VVCGLATCGATFETKHSRQRYCSAVCAKEVRRLRDLRTERVAHCKHCDAVFNPDKTRADYCGPQCRDEAKRLRFNEQRKSSRQVAAKRAAVENGVSWKRGGVAVLRFGVGK